jgi:3,4-dihydroxy 2-butanone 4-phosphate synthase / GTP cyclohydrolase II
MSKSLSDALTRFAKGEFVIVTDDADRENEGDLFLLASAATAEKLAFMIRYTSGVICVAMNEARSRELHLPLMVKQNQDTKRTAFTVTVDAKAGLTTGISAAERANTIRTLADSQATAEDFIRPGHIFPLIAHDGGLKARRGHTEAVVELCRRVGATEVGVISELVNEDGSMMRGTALLEFARLHDIPMITIEELTEELADSFAPDETQLRWAHLPRTGGLWEVATYKGQGGVEHVIMRNGNLDMTPILVRIHSECLTGDVLGSLRCDCGDQLTTSLQEIESVGSGLLIYLRDHEGRGIGLSEKLRAYQLQDQGLDTVDANLALGHAVDERDFLDAVEILKVLGISKVTLMTNNPKKVEALNLAGIQTTAKSIQSIPNQYNVAYLKAKQERLGHDLKGI